MHAAAPVLALAVSAAACASRPADAPSVRTDPPVGEWRLVSGVEDAAPAATLSVEPGGRIAGTGGCNRYVGTWQIDAETPTIGAVAATRRFCPGGASDAEARYFDALSRTAGWIPEDGALVLVAADRRPLLRFAPFAR